MSAPRGPVRVFLEDLGPIEIPVEPGDEVAGVSSWRPPKGADLATRVRGCGDLVLGLLVAGLEAAGRAARCGATVVNVEPEVARAVLASVKVEGPLRVVGGVRPDPQRPGRVILTVELEPLP